MLEKYKAVFLNFFDSYENFIILGHKEPDADCIFSQVVLARFFQKKGKKTCLINEGPFKRQEIVQMETFFAMETPASWLAVEREKTAVVVVDCSTTDRIGSVWIPLEGLPACMLDHHSAGSKFGVMEIVDETIPSTTLIVYTVGEWLGVPMTQEEAEWLFTGFATDTGFFRYLDEHSAPWVEKVSHILAHGVSPRALYNRMTFNKSFTFIGFLQLLLSRVKSYRNDYILTTYEIKKERMSGQSSSDSDFVYQFLLMVEACEIVVFLKENEKEQKITVSLRSKKDVDVGAFAQRHYNGGGHKNAAGFSVAGVTLSQLEDDIVSRLEAEL